MTSRERIESALSHKEPDRVPVDFGSTAVTGIHALAVERLRDYYGLEKRPVKVWEPYQFLGIVEDDLAEVMAVDTIGLFPYNTLFGFPNREWKEFRTPWGQEVLVSADFVVSEAPGGGLYIHPQGDPAAPPSGHMPKSGFFFDAVIRQEPFEEDSLKPEDNLEEFAAVSEEELAYYREEAARVSASGRAVVAAFPGTALGDIALVPAPFLKRPRGIRDISEWYVSLVTRQEFVKSVFERQTEIALQNLEALHRAVGDKVSAVFLCGADFGTQNSQFCSVETFDRLWFPFYKRMNDWIHENTSWKTFKHSCGAVEPFMERFIACGFDIINPVQISAKGMDPIRLKERYGDRIVFWGGGVDTQKTLPFAGPKQVREEVLRLLEIFSRGGGYVFNTVHNIQANVPVENIAAMISAMKEFNGIK